MSNLFSSRRFRLATGSLAIAGTAMVLASCSSGGGSEAGASAGGSLGTAEDPVTVTVMYGSSDFTEDMIAEFESENPNIDINFIEYDATRLNAMLTAGDAPDLVRGGPNANLFAKGQATPLDDYIANSDVVTADDLVSANDAWRFDGTTRGEGEYYGLLKDWSPDTTIWQNEALFEGTGVDPLDLTEPASWDEVLEKAKALKEAGVKYPLGIEWQWGLSNLLMTMVLQQGGAVYSEDMATVDLETPEAERALQWLIDYGQSGVGITTGNPLPDGQDAPTFVAGEMAMTMDGYWFGGNLQSDEAAAVAETASMAPAPTFGERISPIFGGVGAYIPATAKNKDAAWEVLEYFVSSTPAEQRAATGWGLPALESLWDLLPSEQPFQEQAKEAALAETDYVQPLPDSIYMTNNQWDQVVDAELMKGIDGGASVEDVAKSIEDQINTLLAQGKDQLG
ncbi:sugar ABC transporter substrate-binding protein [Demequina sp. SYSU T00192]|uniref:Sugar ABC transporter substrate-binding protein n=1 Tax=Demequina litoralis TaxID=3051660 RepID=A0ABT8GCM0_9MICO|nr:sugar ABC transporter substrate-binding protein [Demequina sp. SYSU T00192]MDN4476879.1 sugar ABC transporter substrate-binding protein [Demequina sp. SYSU T00192]